MFLPKFQSAPRFGHLLIGFVFPEHANEGCLITFDRAAPSAQGYDWWDHATPERATESAQHAAIGIVLTSPMVIAMSFLIEPVERGQFCFFDGLAFTPKETARTGTITRKRLKEGGCAFPANNDTASAPLNMAVIRPLTGQLVRIIFVV